MKTFRFLLLIGIGYTLGNLHMRLTFYDFMIDVQNNLVDFLVNAVGYTESEETYDLVEDITEFESE